MGNDAAERTEQATSRKLGKERDKGNISKSQDMISAIMITTGVSLLAVFSAHIFNKLQVLFLHTFTHLNPKEISTEDIFLLIFPFAKATGEIVLPFLLILMAVAMISIRLQIGKVFATSKIKPDFQKIAPSKMIDGLKKLLNPVELKKIVEFVKSLVKLLIVGVTGFNVLNNRKDELIGLLGLDINTAFVIIGSIMSQMIINMCLAMLVIGILDKKYQDYEFDKSMKMTKQEIKDEHKDTEGDPKIKAKVRGIQMRMAQQRMMSEIPNADVVVTNPTHYAVAIKYDKSKSPAPIVVAKGVDFIAFKIREVAQNNNVPIVENRPLARSLYKLVPIDGIIPSDMFVAVAEVLAYVYNKNKVK